MKVRSTVYMRMTVEVRVGSWEAAQPFEQLHQQAVREAKAKMTRILDGDGTIVSGTEVMRVVTIEEPTR